MEFGRGEGCRIHPTAVVSPKSWIGDRVEIAPHAVIEAYSAVDRDSFIGPGAIVGAEGLQVFATGEGATFVRHAGGVRVGRSVVLLANAVISKAVRPIFTEIGEYCSISLLTGIGHESRLGARCSLASNVVVGGSVTMKDDVWVGPSACIKDGVSIGARARILLGSVVVKDVADGEVLSGNFAIAHHRNLRRQAGPVR
jgi:UDP-3-O-[3-hydroxymyristoyl] glucosamine N-acyltransferase